METRIQFYSRKMDELSKKKREKHNEYMAIARQWTMFRDKRAEEIKNFVNANNSEAIEQ